MVTLSPLASSEEHVGGGYGVEVMTTISPVKSDETNMYAIKNQKKMQKTDYKSISIAIQLWLLFIYWLVVSNICYFPYSNNEIWDVILPIDELHHFSEGLKLPTRSSLTINNNH